jgi:hypothetical protein
MRILYDARPSMVVKKLGLPKLVVGDLPITLTEMISEGWSLEWHPEEGLAFHAEDPKDVVSILSSKRLEVRGLSVADPGGMESSLSSLGFIRDLDGVWRLGIRLPK